MTDKAKGVLVAVPITAVVTIVSFVFSRGKSEAAIETRISYIEARQVEDRGKFEKDIDRIRKSVEQGNRRLFLIQQALGIRKIEPIDSSEE